MKRKTHAIHCPVCGKGRVIDAADGTDTSRLQLYGPDQAEKAELFSKYRGTHQQGSQKLSGKPVFRAFAPAAHFCPAGRCRGCGRLLRPAHSRRHRRDRLGLCAGSLSLRPGRLFPVQRHDAGAIHSCLYPFGIFISSQACF